jgi:RNA polymerase sigma factor (sigma-70 family)
VLNENLNRFRKHRVAERLTDTLPDSGAGALAGSGPADATRQYDDRSALIAALQRLGPRQRAVIVLRYWMDLTEADIAATLDCSVGTVKSQAARALSTLRQSAELVDGELQ